MSLVSGLADSFTLVCDRSSLATALMGALHRLEGKIPPSLMRALLTG